MRRVAFVFTFCLALSSHALAQSLAWRKMATAGLPPMTVQCLAFDNWDARTVLVGTTSTGTDAFDLQYYNTTWTRRSTTLAPSPAGAVLCDFDPGRASTMWFAATPTSASVIQTYTVAETGGSWMDRTSATASLTGSVTSAFYRSSRLAEWVLVAGSIYEVPDSPGFNWVPYATTLPAGASLLAITFDSNRNVTVGVLLLSGGTLAFSDLVGTTWTGAHTIPGATTVSGLVFDSVRNVVIALGAVPRTSTFEYDGTNVVPRTFTTGPSAVGSSAYSPTRKSTAVYDPTDGSLWELGVFVSQGGTCTIGIECVTNVCTDGVCCDAPCGGYSPDDCQACSVAAGAATDGTCQTLPATAICRAAVGACDHAETCTGASTTCPADTLEPASTVCRAATLPCDVPENCPGNGTACPADAVLGTSVICRASVGVCDLAESCNGLSASCPADQKLNGIVCRSSQNLCDAQETCDGVGVGCPADSFAPAGTVCDASNGVCDAVDHCTGSSVVCPEEVVADDTACDDQNACTQASACRTGVCTETLRLDCSDGNACTTDTCQDAIGSCVHTPVAACMSDGGMSGSDAGTTPTPTPAAGCSCRVVGTRAAAPVGAWAFVALVLASAARRSRRRPRC